MKRALALIFGGRSPEHEVSCVSARGIYENLDQEKYECLLLGVTRRGEPRLGGVELLDGGLDSGSGTPCRWPAHPDDRTLRELSSGRPISAPIEIAFPIIHGAGGEDGTLQGILSSAGIPFVGSGVLGSALAMDKDRCRRMLERAAIPVTTDRVFEGAQALDANAVRAAVEPLGLPLFVKPARAGSSLGISKLKSWDRLPQALEAAYAIDTKLLIERAVPEAREIEVAVLGNLAPEASCCGEIVPHGEFYDYQAKYHDAESRTIAPADLDPALSERIRALALTAFRALDLAGLARVDFLLSRTSGECVLNEVNTLPGFTPISMYPKLWEQSGLPYRMLLDRLIALAEEAATRGALRSEE